MSNIGIVGVRRTQRLNRAVVDFESMLRAAREKMCFHTASVDSSRIGLREAGGASDIESVDILLKADNLAVL